VTVGDLCGHGLAALAYKMKHTKVYSVGFLARDVKRRANKPPTIRYKICTCEKVREGMRPVGLYLYIMSSTFKYLPISCLSS
jgi:hypothetical protein